MAILYNKPIKAQSGQYIFPSVEAMRKSNPAYANIRTKNPGSTITRCVGAAHDASKICGVDYRSMVSKGYDKSFRLAGESDDIVDAWNWKDAANNTDEIDVIYDREKHGPEQLDALLKNLPLNSFIGTGDAREKYISKDNKRRSRHGITVLGYLENGTPIVYDLTKFKEGIPAKYKGQINYIAVPAGERKYFKAPAPPPKEEVVAAVPHEEVQKDRAERVPKKKAVQLATVPKRSYFDDFMVLLSDTFNIT